MYPVLFTLGGWQLESYGVFVAIGFFLGIALAMREAREAGEDPQRILDLAFYVVIAAIVGAKLVFLVPRADELARDGWRQLWTGGLDFWGGFVAAVAVAVWYMRRHRLPVARVADMAAPGLLAGLVLAEMGCLAAGCDFGRPTTLPVGIVFRDPRSLSPTGVPLHPTQLYAAGWSLLLLGAVFVAKRVGSRRPGQLALLALGGLGLGHFVIEFLRADPRPMLVPGWLSASQPVELAVGLVALLLWWRRGPGARAASPRPGHARRSTARRG